MRKSVFIALTLLLLTSFIIVGCGAPTPPTGEKTLKIGGLFALTGWWNAAYDNSILRMLEAAVDMINEKGGVNVKGEKYRVELVVEDTQSTFDGVAVAANRLIHEKKIKLLSGPSGFYVSAATPVTEPAKALMMVGWHVNMPGEIDAKTPYTFGTSYGSLPKDIVIIKSMRKDYPNLKKIVLVTPDDGAIPFLIPKVKTYLDQYGFTVAGDVIDFPNEMEDFSPIVAKIVAIKDFEAVFVERCPPPALGAIVKGLREKGYTVPIFVGSPIATAEVATMAGVKATENVRTCIETKDDPKMPPVMAELIKRVTSKYGADFPLSFQCATGLFILKDVIEKAQSLDPTEIKVKLESMNEIDTINGKAIICGEKTYGIKHIIAHPLSVQKFEGGKAVPAGWYEVGNIP